MPAIPTYLLPLEGFSMDYFLPRFIPPPPSPLLPQPGFPFLTLIGVQSSSILPLRQISYNAENLVFLSCCELPLPLLPNLFTNAALVDSSLFRPLRIFISPRGSRPVHQSFRFGFFVCPWTLPVLYPVPRLRSVKVSWKSRLADHCVLGSVFCFLN